MWNKKYILVIFVFLFALSLSAQTYSRRRFRSRRSTTAAAQQSNQEQTGKKKDAANASEPAKTGKSAKSSQSKKTERRGSFDPSKPSLTLVFVTKITTELKKQLLERKISGKLPGPPENPEEADASTSESGPDEKQPEKKEKFDTVSQIDYRIYTTRYRRLVNHFELEEATGIQRAWYKQFLAELDKFEPILFQLYLAIRHHSHDKYRVAVRKFEQHQKACLQFMETAQKSKLGKDQLAALKEQNTRIRRLNYLKQQEEKRRAALQRQQEQLKRLQQKNQPKNLGKQTSAQGSGK